MAENFVKGRETNQAVDNRSYHAWQIVTDTEADSFQTPVQTSNDEKDKRDCVNIHT